MFGFFILNYAVEHAKELGINISEIEKMAKESGYPISIQQKRGTDSVRNKSVEVGTWVDNRTTLAKPTSTEYEYSEMKVYEYISLNELIELLIKLKGE